MTLWIELAASGLITGGIYALVATGLNLQYGLMRIMNISHGEFLMLGAYLTYWAHVILGISPFLLLFLVPPLLFIAGIAVHRICFRPLARTTPDPEAFEGRSLLIGFGLLFLIQNAVFLTWGGDIRGYQFMDQPVRVAGIMFTANKLIAFVFAVTISVVLIGFLRLTMTGKIIRAVMQAPIGAALIGVDILKLQPAVFGGGLALAGFAGVLLSMIYEITPGMGEPYTVTALIVITLGGLGSIGGSLVGGLLLGVIEAFGMHLTSPSLRMLLSYLVFAVILVARPKGLFSR